MVENYDCTFQTDIKNLPKSTNNQSVGSLLVDYFFYYGYCFSFSDVVSIRSGAPISAVSKNWEASPICIEGTSIHKN